MSVVSRGQFDHLVKTGWRQIQRIVFVENSPIIFRIFIYFNSLYLRYSQLDRLILQNTQQWPELEEKAE